ncbi:MAG: HAD family hydrolase [Paludibacteraceae bacterium]|nr:HAD family hydrolase [Paludibacteraceae bacterium]
MLLIFDLDGTLINTIDDLGQACNHALSACGFPTHKIDDYPRLVGNGINKLIERALPEEHRNEATVLRLREHFVPFYDRHNCDLTRPYDGIPELLKALKQKGDEAMRRKGERLFLAVASNKYQAATEKIVAHYFPNTFDVVLGERVGVPRKPDPQIVWDILASLPSTINHKPSTLYVGDSLVDAATAKAANLPFVACTWGFCTKEQLQTAQPNYMVNHPSEILALLSTHNKK